ncbi:hypothetical protein L226DRAFT_614047 [Lentinus tigrinus ALCF2SS1-7]|uniref:Fungal-type protein kinase domain-containing protein n=1 Tax=Lentinus tigrinus ALCF2SS1-6 TaxID=1328759 RepID=A0A5C2S694_9APHY|nr:hypothetical protein L227DRAFT_165672 [Lentinus tigrinus ALCF2SS1-6]RPD73537.1 hypothetical protein L226DRAFT_614047 [Lentinus tigrinus ALCF2SS1-7]
MSHTGPGHQPTASAISTPDIFPVAQTPAAFTENSAAIYGLFDKRSAARYTRLAEEGRRFILGPMPPDAFIEQFLAKGHTLTGMPDPKGAFSALPHLKAKGMSEKAKGKGGKDESGERDENVNSQQDDTPDVLEPGKKAQGKSAEKDLYVPFLEALNERKPDPTNKGHPSRCPGFAFRDTSGQADKANGNVGSVKPDVSVYAEKHLHALDSADSQDAATHIGLIATFVEIKTEIDFFKDPPSKSSSSKKKRKSRAKHSFILDHIKNQKVLEYATRALGQNIAYAAEVCGRQYRQCCYSVSLTGCHARLIRWDRAGAIVSAAFDLHKHPEYLCQFFWYFSQMSDEERGYDMSFGVATEEEEGLFRDTIRAHVISQLSILPREGRRRAQGGVVEDDGDEDHERAVEAELALHYRPGGVSSILLTTPGLSTHERPRKLLVSQPLISPMTMFGRCTRSYWAVDCTWDVQSGSFLGRTVFLKDTWRYNARAFDRQEGDVLDALKQGNVPNIPDVNLHEDICSFKDVKVDAHGALVSTPVFQSTKTQDYYKAVWNCCRDGVVMLAHTHYRLSLLVVGYPLVRLQGSRELLEATYHAFQALKGAEVLGYIHRDVSPSNIILCRTSSEVPGEVSRQGYLCDWDLCRQRKDSKLLDDYEVSATWQFQSIDTLERKPSQDHNHTIHHDMESTLYVTLYCALLYLPHHGGDPASCFQRMFDETHLRGGRVEGGDGKSKNRSNRTYTAKIKWECAPMTEWLNTVMDYHSSGQRDRWNPDVLDTFWRAFLEEKQALLHVNDRCFNIKLLLGKRDENKVEQRASRIIRGMPLVAPYPYGATVRAGDIRKRGNDAEDEVAATGQPPLKVRKTTLTPSGGSKSSYVPPLSTQQLGVNLSTVDTLPASVPPTTVSDNEDINTDHGSIDDLTRWPFEFTFHLPIFPISGSSFPLISASSESAGNSGATTASPLAMHAASAQPSAPTSSSSLATRRRHMNE